MHKIGIVLLVSLAGCAANTPQRQADRIVLRHGGYCEQTASYGTNEWRDCVVTREQERLQRVAGLCRNDGAKLVCERPRPGDLSARENF